MNNNVLPVEQYEELFHNVRKNGVNDGNGNITLGTYQITAYGRNGNEFFGVLSASGKTIYHDGAPHPTEG